MTETVFKRFESIDRFERFEKPRPKMTLIERAKQFAPFNLESAPEDGDLAEHLSRYAGKRGTEASAAAKKRPCDDSRSVPSLSS